MDEPEIPVTTSKDICQWKRKDLNPEGKEVAVPSVTALQETLNQFTGLLRQIKDLSIGLPGVGQPRSAISNHAGWLRSSGGSSRSSVFP